MAMASPLNEKLDIVLSEVRLLVLGAQIIVGFQFQAFFSERFDELPSILRQVLLVGFMLAQSAVLLLVMPGVRHRLVEKGKDSSSLHRFASRIIAIALLPVIATLGLDIWVVLASVVGAEPAAAAAGGLVALALVMWYAVPLAARANSGGDAEADGEEDMDEKTPLKSKIGHLLTEARVVLPGAQALLGFQFSVMLTPAFQGLPEASRLLHVASLLAMTVAVVLLLATSAFHRIAERGEETERFHRTGSRLLVAALIPLALGICGDLYVVAAKVLEAETPALGLTLAMLAFFAAAWFILPLAQARRGRGRRRLSSGASALD